MAGTSFGRGRKGRGESKERRGGELVGWESDQKVERCGSSGPETGRGFGSTDLVVMVAQLAVSLVF